MIDTDNIQVDINPGYTMMKRQKNGLYLSEEEIEILKMYDIDYLNTRSLADLIYLIEEAYEDCDDDILANLLDVLAERNYYENTNK